MADIRFLHLDHLWRLAYDPHQWILQHFRPPKWRAVSFVGGSKVVLMSGIDPTPAAQTTLKSLPDTFREWQQNLKDQSNPERSSNA